MCRFMSLSVSIKRFIHSSYPPWIACRIASSWLAFFRGLCPLTGIISHNRGSTLLLPEDRCAHYEQSGALIMLTARKSGWFYPRVVGRLLFLFEFMLTLGNTLHQANLPVSFEGASYYYLHPEPSIPMCGGSIEMIYCSITQTSAFVSILCMCCSSAVNNGD